MTAVLPKKYSEAYRFLEQLSTEKFLVLAGKEVLDFDVENVSGCSAWHDRTLFRAAVDRQLWDCVDFMLDKATPGWRDVGATYGYAPEELAQRIWTRFLAVNKGTLPATVTVEETDGFTSDLIAAFARTKCHTRLLELMITRGASPKAVYREDFHDMHPLAIGFIYIGHHRNHWFPKNFLWLAENFNAVQLDVSQYHIEWMLRQWTSQWTFVSLLGSVDGGDVTERVFWKIAEFYGDDRKFAELAQKLLPLTVSQFTAVGVGRLRSMLVTLGVNISPADARMGLEKETPCTHCSGTGKIKTIDPELAREAKKRRIEAVSKKQ